MYIIVVVAAHNEQKQRGLKNEKRMLSLASDNNIITTFTFTTMFYDMSYLIMYGVVANYQYISASCADHFFHPETRSQQQIFSVIFAVSSSSVDL